MIFNSIEFLIFFPLVVMMYFLVPHKYRWILLLLASYYFYMTWKPEYILLIIASTLINYFIAITMEKQQNKIERKKYLYLSLIANLGTLFLFKYFDFFAESINNVLNNLNSNVNIAMINLLLPMGISFYTFQTLSYTIDVYRGNIKAEKHLGVFALYVVFFPQLVAGPIERSDKLLPQFYERHDFHYKNVTNGLKRMAWGFFKKVVIADRIAVMVDAVYNNVGEYAGLPLIIATLFFGIQIYCDFSGYSDIAIGAARVMGFDLMENFKRPYFSKSISEFWRRWHISLSSWFKDYLYIPLGGNRVKVSRSYFNLFITFLISGLWHGASWTFVIWGSLHGMYLVCGKLLKPIRENIAKITSIDKFPKVRMIIQMFITTSLVMFAWIFFRANNIVDALYVVRNLFVNIIDIFNPILVIKTLFSMGLNNVETPIVVLGILILFLVSYIQRNNSVIDLIENKNELVKYSLYSAVVLALILLAYVGNSQFIYFQF